MNATLTPAEITKKKLTSLRDLMESSKKQFAMALPKHMTPDRLMRIALTACQKNPKLLECDQKSFLGAMMIAAQLGLEPDGTLGRAYLIPRKGQVCFQPGYLGLLELCQRSGQVASVRAEAVRKGDFLKYEKGTGDRLVHREGEDNFDAEITHVYAVVKTKNGGVYWDCWPAHKVEAHRQRFSKDTRDGSAWSTDWASMAKKTVLTAVLKLAPKSVEVSQAVAVSEQADAGLPQDIDIIDLGAIPSKPADGAPAPEEPRAELDGITQKLKQATPPSPQQQQEPPSTESPPPAGSPPVATPTATAPAGGAALFEPTKATGSQQLAVLIGEARTIQARNPDEFEAVCKRHSADPVNLKSNGLDTMKNLIGELRQIRAAQ